MKQLVIITQLMMKFHYIFFKVCLGVYEISFVLIQNCSYVGYAKC